MNNDVHFYKTKFSQEAIAKSVDAIIKSINFKDSFSSINIKPNLCYYWKASTGYTTDPIVVSAVIDSLRNKFDADVKINIVEADASAMRTKYVFPMLDYTKLSQDKKVDLINLSNMPSESIEQVINGEKIKLKIPKMLLDDNILINVPKFKIMKETHLTCALKNTFGCISTPRKLVYHKKLKETIVAVNKIIKTDAVIVDGIIALENKPFYLNLITGGANPFSVDWEACKIMGYSPQRVGFLNLAHKEGLGDPKKIKLIGDNPKEFIFPTINNTISKHSFKLLFKMLKLYSRIVGDVVPPMFETL